MSLKYMQYMPFFSFNILRGLLSSVLNDEVSNTYGVKRFPYIKYPGSVNVNGTFVPIDKALSYSYYLFCDREPFLSSSFSVASDFLDTGPNGYRLENLMYILDNLCIQHKWRLGEPDKGFIWKIPTVDGYEEFIPEPTQLSIALKASINSSFKIIPDRQHHFLLPISDHIDILGGPVVLGLDTGYMIGNNLLVPPVNSKFTPDTNILTSARDYTWIYYPNTGHLHGITFDNLYIYQQLQEIWEIIGQNLFIDIPGKNYTNISIPINLCVKLSLHPTNDEAEYSANDYDLFKNFDINIKQMLSLWEIPDRLAGEDIYQDLDEKPGWLPLAVDVNSICDYGKLKLFVTDNEELLNNMKKIIPGTNGYLQIYNQTINGQDRNSNLYNAIKAIQYNYFNQFFIPSDLMNGTHRNTGDIDGSLARLGYSSYNITGEDGAYNDLYIPYFFKEIVFGGHAISTEMPQYSDVSSSYNTNKFNQLKAQIEGIGLMPGFKYHYSNTNIENEQFNSPETAIKESSGSYVTQHILKNNKIGYYSPSIIATGPVSAMSYIMENVYREVSDDIEIESFNNGFRFWQKYLSPRKLLNSSKFNNPQAYEKAQANLVYDVYDTINDKRYLNLSSGKKISGTTSSDVALHKFEHPIDNKTFVTQYRLLHSSFTVSCTYVGSKTLRNKTGIRNRLSSISKVYAPYASAGQYNLLSFLYPKIDSSSSFIRYAAPLSSPLTWEKYAGIVQSTDTTVGPATTNFDNNKVKYYYGWVQFPDSILSKENFDMMSMNNYIRLCQYIVNSNPQKTLLFEIPGGADLFLRKNGFKAKNGRTGQNIFGISDFIPREAYCDFDSFLDAEPPFDNAVLFLWCEPDNKYPATYAEGHITSGSLEQCVSGINIMTNSAVQSTFASIVNDTPNINTTYTDFVFLDNNQNLAQTDTQFSSEKMAGFYFMSHNNSGPEFHMNNIYVNRDEYLQKIHDITN